MDYERDCDRPNDCRIQQGTASSTCAYYPPVYDGHGRNLNPDRNVTRYLESCSTCGRSWDVSECAGEVTRTAKLEAQSLSEHVEAVSK